MKCSRCGAEIPNDEAMCHHCGSVLRQVEGEGLSRGTVIAGKYEVVEQIGAGGMGRVYRSLQSPLDIEVCIKTLHKGASLDPQFPARFEREAKTTSQLRHPNIVTVLDFGSHLDGTMYLVMEYIKGSSLADLAGKGQYLPEKRAVRILGQVCDALTAAHGMGVIHRDLKPANIMVLDLPDQPDHVKVLDFGSALILEGSEEERLTQVGTVIGTPAYMAPEYILGRGVNQRVDIYGVGVLLYLLLTGSPPFRGTSQSVFAQHVTVKAELPSKRNPEAGISKAMEKVVMHALVKDPAQRYSSAAELKEAMEKALAGEEEDFDIVETPPNEVGVELAAQERAVVVVVVRGVYGLSKEATSFIKSVGKSCGAWVRKKEDAGVIPLIFGIEGDGTQASAAAIQCAIQLVAQPTNRPISVGVYHSQASCKGQPRTDSFSFELFGGGPGIATSLAACAPPQTVLVSGPVSRFVPPNFQLIPIEPPARFKDPVFVLSDPSWNRVRSARYPLVGREKEQQALVEIAVSAYQGKICLVLGPEGIGKSRLVDEVGSQAARVGTLWCVAPSTADAEIDAAHPASLITALGWNASGGASSSTERHIVGHMLSRNDLEGGDLRGERRQLRLVSSALGGLSQRLRYGQVVVVLDDLHHADDLTWSMTNHLVNTASVIGISLVLCLRDEKHIPFTLPSSTQRIELTPLSERDTSVFLESALEEKVDRSLITRAANLSKGIPQLTEEIVGVIKLGQTDLLKEIQGLDPYEAMDYLVDARIQALKPLPQRLLRTSAVLGASARQTEVLEIVGGDSHDATAALMELESLGLLQRRSGRLSFTFPRIGAVARESASADEWRDLHMAAAEIVAASGKAEIRQLELGSHMLQAEQFVEAFDALKKAGENALEAGQNRRAAYCLELALEAGGQVEDERLAERVSAFRDLGTVLIQLGFLDQAEEVLREGFLFARNSKQAVMGSELLRLHGRAILLAGDIERGRREIETALNFAEKRGDVVVAAQACVDLADASEQAGEIDGAITSLQQGLDLIEGMTAAQAVTVRIQLFNRLGRLELEANNLSRAIALFAQALDLAEAAQDRYQAAGLLGNLGGAYARQHDTAKALHFTEQAKRLSEELGDQIGIARQSFNLALIRLNLGHVESARTLLKQSYEAACRSGWHEGIAMSQAAIAKLGEAV